MGLGGDWKQETEYWHMPETTPLSGKTGQDSGFLCRLRNTWSNWLKVRFFSRSGVVVTARTGRTRQRWFPLKCEMCEGPIVLCCPPMYNFPVNVWYWIIIRQNSQPVWLQVIISCNQVLHWWLDKQWNNLFCNTPSYHLGLPNRTFWAFNEGFLKKKKKKLS